MTHAKPIRPALALAACLCAVSVPVMAEPPMHADAKLIASAERAAPRSVSAKSTVIAMAADGNMRTLRTGANGWTCMPDNPATPGPDSMCMDAAALEWAKAWMGRTTPDAGRIGFMYMLEGGTDASNVDPYAAAPSDDNAWIETGAHVMIVGADAAFYAMYPSDANPDTSVPYVMWAGTPYQHLMIPVE
jgi:hypothetical protein